MNLPLKNQPILKIQKRRAKLRSQRQVISHNSVSISTNKKTFIFCKELWEYANLLHFERKKLDVQTLYKIAEFVSTLETIYKKKVEPYKILPKKTAGYEAFNFLSKTLPNKIIDKLISLLEDQNLEPETGKFLFAFSTPFTLICW